MSNPDSFIDEVTEALSIRTTGRDTLYTLSYRGARPDQALRVVQSMLTIVVASSSPRPFASMVSVAVTGWPVAGVIV